MIGWAMTRLRTRLHRDGWGLLPLRVAIGFGFAAHGWAKLARGPEHFAEIVAALGLPAPCVAAWVTSLLELLGGVALMLGAAVVPLSVPLGAVMLTAMVGVHLRYGFSSVRLLHLDAAGAQFGPVGYELHVLYLAGLVSLALCGAGPLSVDRWMRRRRTRGHPPAGGLDGPNRSSRSAGS